MPLKGEAKAQYMKKYHSTRNSEKAYKEADQEIQRILHEVDSTGDRYKSESLSASQLEALYEKFVYGNDIMGEARTVEQWHDLRDKARKDLFWLGTAVLHWEWVERVHQPVCNFFVQKNFDGCFGEGYTIRDVHNAIEKQDVDHHRLLLDPRAHYKTTIDSVDSLQWLFNVPDIRILTLTAEEENADDFVKQVKKYLYQPVGGDLTDCQLLFPEYVLRGRDGKSIQPFTLAVRKHDQKDPTFWADSIMSTLATQHCDVLKADDVVSNRNSDNELARAKLKGKFDGALHLLDAWGFFDAIGTRYAPDDWYGMRLKAAEEGAALKCSVRSCWTVRKDYEDVTLKELTFDMVDLLFPEKLATPEKTFQYLRTELIINEEDFRCQMLNEPAHVDVEETYINTFTEDNLRLAHRHISLLPKLGKKYIFVDTAMTAGRKADYSACAVVQIEERQDLDPIVWFTEILADRWTDVDTARNIATLAKKWDPQCLFIEDIPSTSNLFKNEVARQMGILECRHVPVSWFKPDLQNKAKENRIRGLQLLHERGLIRIITGSWVDLMTKQLTEYTGHKSNKNYRGGRKDDIPDAMSYVQKVLSFMVGPQTDEEKEEYELRIEKERMIAMHKTIFGNVPMDMRAVNQGVQEEDPLRRGMFGIPFTMPARRN